MRMRKRVGMLSRFITLAVLLVLAGVLRPAGAGAQNNAEKDRPYAVRRGRVIELKPSRATFAVPQEWVEWYDEFRNNFHLSHIELDAVKNATGDFDTEFAHVCNKTLPFELCAAHVGDEGWGSRRSASAICSSVFMTRIARPIR